MRNFLFLVAAGMLAACGGNVVIDGTGGSPTASGGAGGSGGTTTSTITTTTTSTTTSSTTTGCPDPFPGIEASCSVEGLTCPVPFACCGGHATCTGGFWKFSAQPCGTLCSPTCGPDEFACSGGAVCVAYIGKTTTYQCESDPCPPGSLACACAAPLCAQQSMVCDNIQQGFKVLCDCQGDC